MFYTKNEAGEFVEVTTKLYTEEEYGQVKRKNDEFRENNTKLLKSNETLSSFAKVLDGVQNLNPENLAMKIEELASKKAESLVTEMKTKHQQTVDELNQKLQGTSTTLHKFVLGSEVQKAGAKHGVQPTAYEDVLRRAESAFVVRDGKVAFKEEKLDADGNPYSVEAWMADQAKEAPHLFVPPQGPAASRQPGTRVPVAPSDTRDTRSAMEKLAAGVSGVKNAAPKRLN